MTVIGKGIQNFNKILNQSKDVAEWLVVEMDKTFTDVFQILKESYDFMVQNLLHLSSNYC